MGSGKSTVGPKLAQDLGYSFLDTDRIVRKMAGMSIKSIIKKEGEETFRSMESVALRKASEIDKVVIACGGGAIIAEENRRLINGTGYNIMLLTKRNTVMYRLGDSIDRPLWDPSMQNKIIEQRWDHYLRTSDLIVDAESTVSGISRHIINELENYYNA